MNLFVLAQQMMQDKSEILRGMGSRFEQPDPNLYWKIPLVMLLFTGAIFLTWFLYRLQRRRQGVDQSPQPMRLYLRAMRELGLPGPDLWYLYRLAKRLSLPHPTALLVSVQYYDYILAADCCDKAGKVLNRARHKRLTAIRTILFGRSAVTN